jgi:hypothetical protein
VEESPRPVVFVSGAVGPAYPLRGAMRDLARRRPELAALLIADRAVAPQLASLGFIDGEHYLSVTAHDLERVIAHALHPDFREEADAIRRRGHALVHARHTVEERAKAIEGICGG